MMFSGTCWSWTHGYDPGDDDGQRDDDGLRDDVHAQHDAGLVRSRLPPRRWMSSGHRPILMDFTVLKDF